jgi:hypothetical protein
MKYYHDNGALIKPGLGLQAVQGRCINHKWLQLVPGAMTSNLEVDYPNKIFVQNGLGVRLRGAESSSTASPTLCSGAREFPRKPRIQKIFIFRRSSSA